MPIRCATILSKAYPQPLPKGREKVQSPMLKVKSILAILLLAACTTETYDSGDGKYSMMRADFVETRTDASGELYCAVTDDADSLVLSPKRTAKWAATPDSLYRALLYYNVPASGIEVKAISLTSIPAPRVRPKDEVKEITTDPVVFNSAWMSREGRYINLGLSLKTGQAEGVDEKQTVGLMCDEVTTDAEGHKHYMLTLLHEQNGVPQYYSAELFVSIASYRLPEKPVKGDELTIKINTYNGTIEKSFQY